VKIDQIIRTKRKSIALIIKPDGRLVVRAPIRISNADIKHLVKQKERWIREKQKQVKDKTTQSKPKIYMDGEEFLYLGKSYNLKIVADLNPALVLSRKFYLSRRALPKAESVFTEWYREQARAVITERVKLYAARHGFKYRKIRITSARTRWGSCSSMGNLNFTWRLVMAPPEVVDYVVVHELAHLRVNNHSKEFWKQVERIMPDYKQRLKWLKENGQKLTL
jgi:predicted metal-dependent hydrolase